MQALCEEFDEPRSADVRQPQSRRRRQRPGKLCYVPAEADPVLTLILTRIIRFAQKLYIFSSFKT